MVLSPNNFSFIHSRTKNQQKTCWVAPDIGVLKFNTDGAVEGSVGKAGIGEILALVEAMKLFGESKWVDKFKVVFECASKLIIEWILRPHIAPGNSKDGNGLAEKFSEERDYKADLRCSHINLGA
ncbi:hypothetical protein V6N13_013535 [Hibiscus sabdariffa]